jgi:3-oxoacyl-[acyl-carrier protein] reductase
MDMDLDGRVALVTGAQQGIGSAIAIALARVGADVAINYLDDAVAAESVAAGVRKMGRRAVLIQGDVASVAASTAIVTATMMSWAEWISWSTTPVCSRACPSCR